MDSEALITTWTNHRRHLEANVKVLLVEVNKGFRAELQELLERCGCEVSTAVSAEASLELVLTGQFPMVMVPSVLLEMDGLALVDQMRRQVADLEVILTTRDISLDLVQRAFDLQIRDLLRKPLIPGAEVEAQVRTVLRHSVDGQMRLYLLSQLRQMLNGLPPAMLQQAVRSLEERLSSYKGWLGRCDRLIVVESAEELRQLNDSLFEAHFKTEAADLLGGAVRRASRGDINLMFYKGDVDPEGVQATLASLRERAPHLDVVFISPPQLKSAMAALHGGASLYLPRVPRSPDLIVPRLRRVLARHRERRLVGNLLLEMFEQLLRLEGNPPGDELMAQFAGLMGTTPARPLLEAGGPLDDTEVQDSVDFLDGVLDDMLGNEEQADGSAGSGGGAERRIFPRLEEQRVVRFSSRAAPAKTLAYMGNVSEGGLFIRTNRLLSPGTLTELDVSLINEGEEHKLACEGRVMWVDKEGSRGDQGPGIGIKFMLPSDDMTILLRQIISSRME